MNISINRRVWEGKCFVIWDGKKQAESNFSLAFCRKELHTYNNSINKSTASYNLQQSHQSMKSILSLKEF
jgi:hypothetical protein